MAKEVLEKKITVKEKEKLLPKIENMLKVLKFFQEFDQFTNVEAWRKRFEVTLPVYLESSIDPNLKIFMGMHTRNDVMDE